MRGMNNVNGQAVAQLVVVLRYKPEGHGFDSRWCHWNFSLTWSNRPHYGPGVGSVSNTNEVGGGGLSRPVRMADNFTTVCRLSWNLGDSTSWNSQGVYRDCFTFLFLWIMKNIWHLKLRTSLSSSLWNWGWQLCYSKWARWGVICKILQTTKS
jgi:hypothetical protein